MQSARSGLCATALKVFLTPKCTSTCLEIPILLNYSVYDVNWVSLFKASFFVFKFRLGVLVLVFISSYNEYFFKIKISLPGGFSCSFSFHLRKRLIFVNDNFSFSFRQWKQQHYYDWCVQWCKKQRVVSAIVSLASTLTGCIQALDEMALRSSASMITSQLTVCISCTQGIMCHCLSVCLSVCLMLAALQSFHVNRSSNDDFLTTFASEHVRTKYHIVNISVTCHDCV